MAHRKIFLLHVATMHDVERHWIFRIHVTKYMYSEYMYLATCILKIQCRSTSCIAVYQCCIRTAPERFRFNFCTHFLPYLRTYGVKMFHSPLCRRSALLSRFRSALAQAPVRRLFAPSCSPQAGTTILHQAISKPAALPTALNSVRWHVKRRWQSSRQIHVMMSLVTFKRAL